MHFLQAHVTCWFISGAVRYVTRKPTNEFEANVKGTVGSFSRADVQSMVNVPFSDTVFGRFTAASLSQDGWITQLNGRENLGNRNDKMIRAQIRAEPNDSLTLDFTLDYVDYENDGAAQYMQNPVDTASWYNRYQNFNPQVPDFPVVATSPDCDFSPECSIPGTGIDEYADGETTIGTAVVAWTISDTLSFKSVTSYLTLETREINDWDLSETPVFTVGQVGEPDTRKWEESSQEFLPNGVGWNDRLNWTAGRQDLQCGE